MIPDKKQVIFIWDKYEVPEQKRAHMMLVAKVAVFIGIKINNVNIDLLQAAALLHDIDKTVGGKHPETAVRILREEGMSEVAEVVATHSLHAILDSKHLPKTWEQKILYLADKMVKYDIVGVDKRFKLWEQEKLPQDAKSLLQKSYPKVKELEKEVFNIAKIRFHDILNA